METTYISNNSFSVVGDRRSDFNVGRRLKLDCGIDGTKYASIVSSEFTTVTTVVIDESELTSNLVTVMYSPVKPGIAGNLPNHTHSSTEGDGGYIAEPTYEFTGLTDTPATYSGADGLYAQVSGTEIIFAEGSDIKNFIDLEDTPNNYDNSTGLYSKSTGTGVVWDDPTSTVQEIFSGTIPPGVIGKIDDYYVDEAGQVLYKKKTEASALTAKTIIVDIADNWGGTSYMAVRAIDLKFEGSTVETTAAYFTAYETSYGNASYAADKAFDSTLSKNRGSGATYWYSASDQLTNQRLICVYDSIKTFDQFDIVNYYDGNTAHPARGVRNIKIYTSDVAYTDTTYGADVASLHLAFDGEVQQQTGNTGVRQLFTATPQGTGWYSMLEGGDELPSTTDKEGFYLQATGSGVVWSEVTVSGGTGSSDVQTFLDLDDTPISYPIDGDFLNIAVDGSSLTESVVNYPLILRLSDNAGTTSKDLTPFFEALTLDPNDSFIGVDGASPNSDLWQVSGHSNTTTELQSNRLRLGIPVTADDQYASVISKFRLTGDFDVQITYNEVFLDRPSSSVSYPIQFIMYYDDGQSCLIGTTSSSSSSTMVVTSSNAMGSIWTTDSPHFVSGKLRLTRTGTVNKVYCWSGSQWEWNGNTDGYTFTANTRTEDLRIRLTSTADFNGGSTVDFSEFKINSGTIVWSNGHPSEKKLSLQDINGAQYPIGIEKWDLDNKEMLLHTKVPVIASNAITNYRLFYGDSIGNNPEYVSNMHELVDKGFTEETFTAEDGTVLDKHDWYTDYDLWNTPAEFANVTTNIQNNKLTITDSSTAAGRGNVASKGKLTGNFDLQYDWTGSTVDEISIYIWKDLTSTNDRIYIGTDNDGANIRGDSNIAGTWAGQTELAISNSYGSCQVIRTGTSVELKYKDGDGAWQTLDTFTWISDDAHIVLHMSAPTTAGNATFDNLKLNSGTFLETGAYSRVWDDNFTAVYDLNQSPVTGQTVILDATANSQHATVRGSLDSTDLVDGFYNKGIRFDADGNWIQIPDGVFSHLSHTAEYLAKFDVGAGDGIILAKGGDGESIASNQYRWDWGTTQATTYYEYGAGGANGPTTAFTLSTNPRDLEYHMLTTVQGINSTKVAIDNYVAPMAIGDGNTDTTAGTALGACYNVDNAVRTYSNFRGVVDFVRISSIIRSDSWIKATNLAVRDQLVSYEFGSTAKYLAPSILGTELEFKDLVTLKDISFLDLVDTPNEYFGQEDKLLSVNSSGIEFIPRNEILSQTSVVTSTGTITLGDTYSFKIDGQDYDYYIYPTDNFLSLSSNLWYRSHSDGANGRYIEETFPGMRFSSVAIERTGDAYSYLRTKVRLTGDYSITLYGEVIHTDYNGSGLEIKAADTSDVTQGYVKAGYDAGADRFASNITSFVNATRSSDLFAIRIVRDGTTLYTLYSDGQTGSFTQLNSGTTDTGTHDLVIGQWTPSASSTDQIIDATKIVLDYTGGYEIHPSYDTPTISGMLEDMAQDINHYSNLDTSTTATTLTMSGTSTFDVTNLESSRDFNIENSYQYLGSIESFPDVPNDPEPYEVLRRNSQGTAYEWADAVLPEGRQQIILSSQAYGDYSIQINTDTFINRGLSIDPLYSFSVRNGLFLEDRDRLTLIHGGTGTELVTGQVNPFAKKWDTTGSSYTKCTNMKADIFDSNASLSFWYYVDFVTSWLPFIGKSDPTNSEWRCWLGNDEIFDLFGSGSVNWDISGLSLTTDWHHFVVTYDGTDAELFVNGTSQGTRAYTPGSSVDTIFYINTNAAETGFADGAVDSIKIFEDILTAADITKLYNETPVSDYISLISSDINTNDKYTAEVIDEKIYARTMYPIDVSMTTGSGLKYELPPREISIESLTGGNYKEKVYIKTGLTANQGLTDTVTLSLDTVYDGDIELLTTSSGIKAPESGRYNIKYQISFVDNTDDNTDLYEIMVQTKVNGVLANQHREGVGHELGWNGMSVNGEVPALFLAKDDEVTFTIGQWNQVHTRYIHSSQTRTWVYLEKTHDPGFFIGADSIEELTDTAQPEPNQVLQRNSTGTGYEWRDLSDGIILKSPDQTEWLLGVTNSGTLTITEV